MKSIPLISLVFCLLFIHACSKQPNLPEITDNQQPMLTPMSYRNPTSTSIPSSTPLPTSTPTTTPTITITPTQTVTPTLTATPLGGGTGLIQIQSCIDRDFLGGYDCTKNVYSLSENQIVSSEKIERTEFKAIEIREYFYRLDMVDPDTGGTKIILGCPEEYDGCNLGVLFGSAEDEWVYVIRDSDPEMYDGKSLMDLYKVNTQTGESIALDHFTGYISWFEAFPGSSRGLLSVLEDGYINGALLVYDLETQESQVIAEFSSQFYRFGYSPNLKYFWYRFTDYCYTELVSVDGEKISTLNHSDGILGWLDEDNFLLFTAENNPPYCTANGIAVANQYGLTGKWITQSAVDVFGAQISPDGQKLVYTTECNNNGCRKVIVANIDGSDAYVLIDKPDFTANFNGKFSSDGNKIFYILDNQFMMVNIDGSDPKIFFDSGEASITDFRFSDPLKP